jgi:hypothetical protein
MWAGTSALQSIDNTLTTIRGDVVRLDSQLNQLTGDMASNQRHRAQLFADIAAVRLAEIDSGDLNASMTSADIQVEQLLEQRDIALQRTNEEVESINTELQQAEQERLSLLESVNQKSQEIVDVEGLVQSQLKNDSAYLEQFERAKQAELVAGEAQRKQAAAQASLSAKAAPYRADDLFMYLWDRGYGTTEYDGGLFSRFMDGWVAKLIQYEPARVNFWNLTEIPKRLAEHAEHVATLAENEYTNLQLLETQATTAAGVTELERELELRRDKLDAHDDTIENIEENLNEKLDERSLYTTGGDDFMQQSLACLTRALEHQSLRSIHEYVSDTVSHTDDMLVLDLQRVEDKLDNAEDDLDDVRNLHNAHAKKLKELEKVRRDFKNSRFDDVRSGFGNQTLITSVLRQFSQGAVTGNDVWKVIKRNQRYREVASSPNFGSSALGEIVGVLGEELLRQTIKQGRRRRSTWHRPRPRGGAGGFNIPRGGGSRSGGFRTGGGFGSSSGGFKTGGGF